MRVLDTMSQSVLFGSALSKFAFIHFQADSNWFNYKELPIRNTKAKNLINPGCAVYPNQPHNRQLHRSILLIPVRDQDLFGQPHQRFLLILGNTAALPAALKHRWRRNVFQPRVVRKPRSPFPQAWSTLIGEAAVLE